VLEFRVLGPFAVVRDGVPLAIGGRRQRAFLALLVLHGGEVVSRDRLIDTLWGERTPPSAAHVLHVYASQLRSVLDADVLVTRSPGYVLDAADDQIDLRRFERLFDAAQVALARGDAARACAFLDDADGLWHGTVLEDLAHEEFVQAEARRLEELRIAAAELRAEAAIARGPDGADMARLQALAVAQPSRERTHALLIRALAATGRQAEALDVYGRLRARLDEELGIEPGADLRAAHLAVLRQETTAPAPAAPLPARTPRGTVLAVVTDPARLAGIAAVADRAAAARGRELILACVLPAASRDQLGVAAAAARDARRDVAGAARTAAFVSGDPAAAISQLATEHDADLVVCDGHGITADGILTRAQRELLATVTADVALVLQGRLDDGPVACPFGGSVHDWAAVELAALLAHAQDAPLRLIGVVSDGDDSSRHVARAGLSVQGVLGIDTDPVLAVPGAPGLIGAAQGCSCLVLGLSDLWRSVGLGAVRAELAAGFSSLVVVRRGVRPGLLASDGARSRFAWSVVS
jgi:DNA-binding SARP family transcriptional activator